MEISASTIHREPKGTEKAEVRKNKKDEADESSTICLWRQSTTVVHRYATLHSQLRNSTDTGIIIMVARGGKKVMKRNTEMV